MQGDHLFALLSVGALLAAMTKGVTTIVFDGKPDPSARGWRGVFYVTLWAHPILIGALVGAVLRLPSPAFLGDAVAGRAIWFALSGVFSSSAYSAVNSAVKQRNARGE